MLEIVYGAFGVSEAFTVPDSPDASNLQGVLKVCHILNIPIPNASNIQGGSHISKVTCKPQPPNIPNVPVASNFHIRTATVFFLFSLETHDPPPMLFISVMSSFLH